MKRSRRYLRAGKTIDEHYINEFLTKLFKGNLDNDSTVNFYEYLDFVDSQKYQGESARRELSLLTGAQS